MFFSYLVQAGDVDTDGASIGVNALTLNRGSIAAAADGTVNTVLTHDTVAADATPKVDGGPAPPPMSVDRQPFFTAEVAERIYEVDAPVSMTLPAAVGGDGVLSYALTPALPTGLAFRPGDDRAVRHAAGVGRGGRLAAGQERVRPARRCDVCLLTPSEIGSPEWTRPAMSSEPGEMFAESLGSLAGYEQGLHQVGIDHAHAADRAARSEHGPRMPVGFQRVSAREMLTRSRFEIPLGQRDAEGIPAWACGGLWVPVGATPRLQDEAGTVGTDLEMLLAAAGVRQAMLTWREGGAERQRLMFEGRT